MVDTLHTRVTLMEDLERATTEEVEIDLTRRYADRVLALGYHPSLLTSHEVTEWTKAEIERRIEAAYQRGLSEGSSLLSKLADGRATLGEFQDMTVRK